MINFALIVSPDSLLCKKGFDEVYLKGVELYFQATKIFQDAIDNGLTDSFEDIKHFLYNYNSAFIPKLENIKDVRSLVIFLRNQSSLLHCTYLQALAENFQLQALQDLVSAYTDKLEIFCQEIKASHEYSKKLMEIFCKPKISETGIVVFSIKWEEGEPNLALIISLLKGTFEEEAKNLMIKAVLHKSSVIFCTCFLSHIELLAIISMQNKSNLLRHGVNFLQVGQFMIIDKVRLLCTMHGFVVTFFMLFSS